MWLPWCYWWRFCIPAAMRRLYCILFCSHIAAFQNFFMSSLVGRSMMVIRFPCSSSSFDWLFCWYCFCLLWYLEGLLLRIYRRWVLSQVDLVCSSTIWYFAFIVFLSFLVKVLDCSFVIFCWYQYEANLFANSYWMSNLLFSCWCFF